MILIDARIEYRHGLPGTGVAARPDRGSTDNRVALIHEKGERAIKTDAHHLGGGGKGAQTSCINACGEGWDDRVGVADRSRKIGQTEPHCLLGACDRTALCSDLGRIGHYALGLSGNP